VAGGAMMLDVNMGAPLADEAELMTRAVRLIQSLTDLPLCLDSSMIEVLEAGLAAYQGKALVNSGPAGWSWPARSWRWRLAGTASPSRTSCSTRWPCRWARTPRWC